MKIMRGLAFALLFSAGVLSSAQDPDFSYIKKVNGKVIIPPEKSKPVVIPKFKFAPVIDGILDDPVWKEAAIFRDFYQTSPGDNIAPSKPTVVYMGYDEKNLYIAFQCFDEREKIRATLAKRDDVFGEDNVRVWLDTYNDERRAYVLGFNPFGIQQDGIYTEGKGVDYSVDVLMESKGLIHDWGWAVEVKIPFSSLRYEAGKGKLWGFNLARNIDRLNDEFDEWMPIDRNISGRLIQHGKITGFDGIKSPKNLEILPSLTLRESGRKIRASAGSENTFKNEPIDYTAGISLKYSLASNITFDMTINPDFAEIEADAPVVLANQRFPISFPEKRSFFLEGTEIFQTPIQVFYSRAIISPDLAVKLTGKKSGKSFGVLLASDKGPGTFSKEEINDPNMRKKIEEFLGKRAIFSVVRLKKDVSRENSTGFFGSYRSFPEQKNLLLSLDGRYKINTKEIVQFQVAGSYSRRCFFDPEFEPAINPTQAIKNKEICGGNVFQEYRNGIGIAYLISLDHTAETKGFFIEASGRSRDYRADAGFTRRTNTNSLFGIFRLSTKSKPRAKLIRASWFNSANINYDWRGRIQEYSFASSLELNFQKNTSFRFEGRLGFEKLYEEEFGLKRMPSRPDTGLFFGDNERSTPQASLSARFTRQFGKTFSSSVSSSIVFNEFDLDFGVLPRFPRVSPASMLGSNKIDPGTGNSYNFSYGFEWKPISGFRLSSDYQFNSLFRKDTDKKVFDSQLLTVNSTYQFTKFVFLKGRLDYDSVSSNFKTQFLFGWTPSPGKSFYAGYNDNFNYNGFNPYSGVYERGFERNSRTFFIRMTYLIKESFD